MRRVCGHALQLFITERIALNHPTRGVCRGENTMKQACGYNELLWG